MAVTTPDLYSACPSIRRARGVITDSSKTSWAEVAAGGPGQLIAHMKNMEEEEKQWSKRLP
jgi:hypothetical protein